MHIGVCDTCDRLQIVEHNRSLLLKPPGTGRGSWYARCRLRHGANNCKGFIRPVPDAELEQAMEAAHRMDGMKAARDIYNQWRKSFQPAERPPRAHNE